MKRGDQIIWIAPRWPFPATDGASVATATLVEHLASSGVTIDLIACVPRGTSITVPPDLAKHGVRSYHVITLPTGGRGIVRRLRQLMTLLFRPDLPMTMAVYGLPAIARRLEIAVSHLREQGASLVLYDGLHPAAHASRSGCFDKSRLGLPVVYRAHNTESVIVHRLMERSSPLVRWFLRVQRDRLDRFERSVVESADLTATVSETDLTVLKRMVPSLNGAGHVVPIGMEFGAPMPFGEREQICFVGRLDWGPNQEGLRWFLTEVWPEVVRRRPALTMVIAGSGDPEPLLAHLRQRNVTFLGKVPEVDAVYCESILAVVPIFYGSGTRVKAIEAARFGRSVVSTAVGMEGLPMVSGRDYLEANSAAEWIETLVSLSGSRAAALGKSAYGCAKQHFDAAQIASKFSQLLIRSLAREGDEEPITTRAHG